MKEFLGLAGLDLLSVTWNCDEATPGTLVLRSKNGIQGMAEDCCVRFSVAGDEVSSKVQYNRVSVLGVLAGPVVAVDNWMSLNVLLPQWTQHHSTVFEPSWGSLYGVAGVPHLVDLLLVRPNFWSPQGHCLLLVCQSWAKPMLCCGARWGPFPTWHLVPSVNESPTGGWYCMGWSRYLAHT